MKHMKLIVLALSSTLISSYASAQGEKEILSQDAKISRGTVIAMCLKEKVPKWLLSTKNVTDQRPLFDAKLKYFWDFDGKNSRYLAQVFGPTVDKKSAEKSLENVRTVYKTFSAGCVDDKLKKYVDARTQLIYNDENTGEVLAQIDIVEK